MRRAIHYLARSLPFGPEDKPQRPPFDKPINRQTLNSTNPRTNVDEIGGFGYRSGPDSMGLDFVSITDLTLITTTKILWELNAPKNCVVVAIAKSS